MCGDDDIGSRSTDRCVHYQIWIAIQRSTCGTASLDRDPPIDAHGQICIAISTSTSAIACSDRDPTTDLTVSMCGSRSNDRHKCVRIWIVIQRHTCTRPNWDRDPQFDVLVCIVGSCSTARLAPSQIWIATHCSTHIYIYICCLLGRDPPTDVYTIFGSRYIVRPFALVCLDHDPPIAAYVARH